METMIFRLEEYGIVGHTGDLREGQFAVEISTKAIGQWSEWKAFGATRIRYKDALRCILFVKAKVLVGNTIGIPNGHYKPGQVIELTIPNFYQEIANPDSHDYCLYCGGDNGLNSEHRQGWDCYYCGGN